MEVGEYLTKIRQERSIRIGEAKAKEREKLAAANANVVRKYIGLAPAELGFRNREFTSNVKELLNNPENSDELLKLFMANDSFSDPRDVARALNGAIDSFGPDELDNILAQFHIRPESKLAELVKQRTELNKAFSVQSHQNLTIEEQVRLRSG